MSYSVVVVEKFKKEAKRLVRKYPSLIQELRELAEILAVTPNKGTPLGGNVYKIRLAIRSKGKGKSAGARVITYVVTEDLEVYLLAIYDKSEFDNIDDKIIKHIIKDLQKGR